MYKGFETSEGLGQPYTEPSLNPHSSTLEKQMNEEALTFVSP